MRFWIDPWSGSEGPAALLSAAAARLLRLTKGQLSRYNYSILLFRRDYSILLFRRDGVMGLFLILFWWTRVVGEAFLDNSRFGEFNSRLGPNKFPFSRLRELTGKGLIRFTVFASEMAKIGGNRKNSRLFSRFMGICPATEVVAASHGADLIEPAR